MASSIALRIAAAMFGCISQKPTSTVFTPSAYTRSFATTSFSTVSQEDIDNFPIVFRQSPGKFNSIFKLENPFQKSGPLKLVEVDQVTEGTLVRLSLPGVGPDGVKVWAENNTVFFDGEGDIELEGDKSGRKYEGSLEFQPEFNRAGGVEAQVVNGVLRLLIPYAEGGEKKKKTDGL
ncbi:hypothetical protein C3L33_05189, partial [Rhododendron williamsianum]